MITLLAVAAGSSCAIQRPPPASTTRWRPTGKIETLADGTQVICQMERPVGTNIAEPVCRKVDSMERTKTQIDLTLPKPTPFGGQ